MKNYTITVNGNVYDVTVEENADGAVQAAVARRGLHGAEPDGGWRLRGAGSGVPDLCGPDDRTGGG